MLKFKKMDNNKNILTHTWREENEEKVNLMKYLRYAARSNLKKRKTRKEKKHIRCSPLSGDKQEPTNFGKRQEITAATKKTLFTQNIRL